MGLVPTDILPSTPVIVPGSPPVSVAASSSSNQKLLRTDKLEVNHFLRQVWQQITIYIHIEKHNYGNILVSSYPVKTAIDTVLMSFIALDEFWVLL